MPRRCPSKRCPWCEGNRTHKFRRSMQDWEIAEDYALNELQAEQDSRPEIEEWEDEVIEEDDAFYVGRRVVSKAEVWNSAFDRVADGLNGLTVERLYRILLRHELKHAVEEKRCDEYFAYCEELMSTEDYHYYT